MDDDKGILEKMTHAVKSAANTAVDGAMSIVHPASGTPMPMPLNEAGYALPKPPAPPQKKAAAKTAPAKKSAPKKAAKKKTTKTATKKPKTAPPKKTVKKSKRTVAKKKIKKSKR